MSANIGGHFCTGRAKTAFDITFPEDIKKTVLEGAAAGIAGNMVEEGLAAVQARDG